MRSIILYLFIVIFFCVSCDDQKANKSVPFPSYSPSLEKAPQIDQEIYQDKILGALVGSAIGDAMGAPVEMWNRYDIRNEHDWVSTIIPVTRTKSPEGTWLHNMPSGSTTDDTRWKYLYTQFLLSDVSHRDTILPREFAAYIAEAYDEVSDRLRSDDGKEINKTTDIISQLQWLQEWAQVARAYQKSTDSYNRALHRFYGGEMSCAGMLYAPMIGLACPGQPRRSYTQGYDNSIFDIGYARDLSALLSAMTSLAMTTSSTDSLLQLIIQVDPYGYEDSRLIGRLAHNIYRNTHRIVTQAESLSREELYADYILPSYWQTDTLAYAQVLYIYGELDKRLQDIPFHAGEIFMISLAALEYAQGDFMKAMQFITNYGRDNDTVAAVVGMIIGAQIGYSNLPQAERDQVTSVNLDVIGIDLQEMASDLTTWRYASQE